MGIEALHQKLFSYRMLMLDTMVFSYQLGDHPRYAPLTTAILKALQIGDIAGLTTTVTLAEILSLPARANDRRALQDYEVYLVNFPNLYITPLDTALARETAWVRGTTGLRMPDAVQVAAARLYQADAIVTNDLRWVGKVQAPELIILEEYA